MAIQWFPGHMNKTRQMLKDHIEFVDGVLEVVDARAPLSSRNPLLNEIIGTKKRLILLNKCDCADPVILKQWYHYFEGKNLKTLTISAKSRKNIDRIKSEVAFFTKKKNSTATMREKRAKVLIVGVPNCGKSTLINALARQKKANTADKPGVTRDMALYKVGNFDLYDSPGTLWPNLEDQLAASRLAALGSIKDEIYLASEAFEQVYPFLKANYAKRLCDRYQLEITELYNDFALAVALKLGKGEDIEKGALAIFKDLREGRLGLICLEKPE